jgi:hypothetical protein
MKVKVFELYAQMEVPRIRVAPSAETVERALQEWLNNNPNAKIEHVVPAPLAGDNGHTSTLLMTIFYRD